MKFYIGFGMQCLGLLMVGMCFFTGLFQGDYSSREFYQLILGVLLFYMGSLLRTPKVYE